MKKNIITVAIIIYLTFTSFYAEAQSEGPGNPGGEPSGETPIGGGAPIGSGTLILLGLGVVYGGRKTYKLSITEKEIIKKT